MCIFVVSMCVYVTFCACVSVSLWQRERERGIIHPWGTPLRSQKDTNDNAPWTNYIYWKLARLPVLAIWERNRKEGHYCPLFCIWPEATPQFHSYEADWFIQSVRVAVHPFRLNVPNWWSDTFCMFMSEMTNLNIKWFLK